MPKDRHDKLAEHEDFVRENVLSQFEEDLEEFLLDDCELTDRHDRKRYPFTGMKVWLLPFSSSDIEAGAIEYDEGKQSAGFQRLCSGLADVLAGWTILDVRGRPRPQPYGNPEAVAGLPTLAVFHLLRLHQTGETKAARKNASTGGPPGGGTPESTVQTTPS